MTTPTTPPHRGSRHPRDPVRVVLDPDNHARACEIRDWIGLTTVSGAVRAAVKFAHDHMSEYHQSRAAGGVPAGDEHDDDA